MTLYIPHSIFHFGAAFVCQAGNFWTLLRKLPRTHPTTELKFHVKIVFDESNPACF